MGTLSFFSTIKKQQTHKSQKNILKDILLYKSLAHSFKILHWAQKKKKGMCFLMGKCFVLCDGKMDKLNTSESGGNKTVYENDLRKPLLLI